MLKIAMISPLPPVKTGESPYTAQLIQELVFNSQVKIAAITNPEADVLPTYGDRVKTIRIWNGRSLRYPLVLWKRIMAERPHIVHVQFGPHGDVYGGLFGEVMLILLLLLRLGGIKTTITLHSTWMVDQVIERVETYRKLRKISILAMPIFKIYMKILEWGTIFTQLSTAKKGSSLRRAFLQEYGYPPQKVGEIPHPCQQISEIPERNISKQILHLTGKKVILVFGYIRRGKGIEHAINAMKVLQKESPDTVLLIAGRPLDIESEWYLDELVKLTEDMNLNEVVMFDARYIPQEEIGVYFSAADVVLIPYTESIGASGPIHNYAGYGRAIVASDVGYHMKETLGGSLALFENNNVNSLVQALREVLSKDSLREEMGRRNVVYAERETWRLAARRTLEYYREIVNLS